MELRVPVEKRRNLSKTRKSPRGPACRVVVTGEGDRQKPLLSAAARCQQARAVMRGMRGKLPAPDPMATDLQTQGQKMIAIFNAGCRYCPQHFVMDLCEFLEINFELH